MALFVDDAPKPMPSPKRKRGKKRGRRPSLPGQLKHSGKTVPAPSKAPAKARKAAPRVGVHDAGTQRVGVMPASSVAQPTARRNGTVSGRDLQYAAGVLECVKGPEEGLSLSLMEGEYTIGRGRNNTFVLKDIAASREHVKIEVKENRVYVTDLGSGNGTRVNGERCAHAELAEGDRIEIGNSVLQYAHLGKDESALSQMPTAAPPPVESNRSDQQRIVMAAERLAAELADRFHDFDDGDSGPTKSAKPRRRPPPPVTVEPSLLPVTPAHPMPLPGPPPTPHSGPFVSPVDVPRAAAVPAAPVAPRVAAAPQVSLAAAVPNEMWADGDTRTRLPDEAAAARARPMVSLDPPMPPPEDRPPVYRAQVQGVVVAQAESSGGGGKLWLGMALLTIVLVGAVVATYFLVLRDRIDIAGLIGGEGVGAPEVVEGPYADMMAKANTAVAEKDTPLALAYIEHALTAKPNDTAALALRKSLEEAPTPPVKKGADSAATPKSEDAPRGDAKKASVAPEKTKESGSPAAPHDAPAEPSTEPSQKATPSATPSASKGATSAPPKGEEKAAATPAKKAPAAAAPKEASPKKAAPKKVAPKKVAKKAAPKPARAAKKKAPKRVAKKAPRRTSKKKSSKMDCAEAKTAFAGAIRGIRANQDYDTACKVFSRVKSKAPAGCVWQSKAKLSIPKYCQ